MNTMGTNKCCFELTNDDQPPMFATIEWEVDHDEAWGRFSIGLSPQREPILDDGGSIYFDEDGRPTLVWEIINVEPRLNGLGTAILHLVARTSPFANLNFEAELVEETDREIREARDALWRRCTMSPAGDTVESSPSGVGRVEGRLVDPYTNGSRAKRWNIRQIHTG